MPGTVRIATFCIASLLSVALLVKARSGKLQRAHSLHRRIVARMRKLKPA